MKTARIILSITCAITSICCKILVNDDSKEFKNYLKEIPFIKLPLEINCDSDLKPTKAIFENGLIDKFGISNSLIYGKIKTPNNYSAIIYLIPASKFVPVIKTTDENGNPIDTLYLLGNCGINEECSYASSFVSITPDLAINTIDSIRTCVLDTLDHPKPGSEKLKVENRNYIINKNGVVQE